jgi:hypothetical protein
LPQYARSLPGETVAQTVALAGSLWPDDGRAHSLEKSQSGSAI